MTAIDSITFSKTSIIYILEVSFVYFLYFLISFIATTLGAIAGLGGGVIIKPFLDVFSDLGIQSIGILSSITVFSMSIVSLSKLIKKGFKIDMHIWYLILGSAVGGIGGKVLFDLMTSFLNHELVTCMQSIILVLLLTLVLFKNRVATKITVNKPFLFFLGVLLGCIASFLGIGGGPINVAILYIFLGVAIKDATAISILIIFFSQFFKISTVAITDSFAIYDLDMLSVMIPAAIVGGVVGATLHQKLENNTINLIFRIMIILVISLNLYNVNTVLDESTLTMEYDNLWTLLQNL